MENTNTMLDNIKQMAQTFAGNIDTMFDILVMIIAGGFAIGVFFGLIFAVVKVFRQFALPIVVLGTIAYFTAKFLF